MSPTLNANIEYVSVRKTSNKQGNWHSQSHGQSPSPLKYVAGLDLHFVQVKVQNFLNTSSRSPMPCLSHVEPSKLPESSAPSHSKCSNRRSQKGLESPSTSAGSTIHSAFELLRVCFTSVPFPNDYCFLTTNRFQPVYRSDKAKFATLLAAITR